MSLFWILFPTIVFFVVLSWTDLQSHVGYAVCISKYEGWWKFPLIWLQSFFIPSCFLRSGRSNIDFDIVANVERACRIALSDDPKITLSFDKRRDIYEINGSRDLYFRFKDNDSVDVNGYDKLIPPRVAFLMLAVRDKINAKVKAEDLKPKSLIS